MKYKNLSDQELMIPGVGVVKPGETIESTVKIENPNLELVEGAPAQPQAPVQPAPQPVKPVQEGERE